MDKDIPFCPSQDQEPCEWRRFFHGSVPSLLSHLVLWSSLPLLFNSLSPYIFKCTRKWLSFIYTQKQDPQSMWRMVQRMVLWRDGTENSHSNCGAIKSRRRLSTVWKYWKEVERKRIVTMKKGMKTILGRSTVQKGKVLTLDYFMRLLLLLPLFVAIYWSSQKLSLLLLCVRETLNW